MALGEGPERGIQQREGRTRGLFTAALAGIGGAQRVLLVGELWDRSPRHGLLQDFTRDVFGKPGGAQCAGCSQNPDIQYKVCGQSPQGPLISERCALPLPAPQERRLRAPLIFALFRLSAVQTPAESRRLREILRDVRQRNGGRRAAVVGIVVLPPDPELQKPFPTSPPTGVLGPPDAARPVAVPTSSGVLGSPAGSAPIGAIEPPAGPAPLGAPEPILLSILSSVFLPANPQRPPGESPLQTAVYQPGDPRSALGVMEAACRALRAADPAPDDEEDELTVPTILKCFPWKRRRRKGISLKAGKNPTGETPQHPDEGIALKTLCKLSNGACEENHTDT